MSIETLSRDENAKALWDAAYADLDGQPNLWGDPPVPYAANAARLFVDNSAFTVLDLPCGDGRNLPTLALSAPVVIAADTATHGMAIAERVVQRHGHKNVIFMSADIFHTPFPSNSIDGIFCWDMLGHLTEPEKAIRELHRICRPGGHIVANMWTMGDCQPKDPNIREIGPKEYVDHFDFYCKFYDEDDLVALLRSVDLSAQAIDLIRWTEPPHAGYRRYWHEHESLAFTIRKDEPTNGVK